MWYRIAFVVAVLTWLAVRPEHALIFLVAATAEFSLRSQGDQGLRPINNTEVSWENSRA